MCENVNRPMVGYASAWRGAAATLPLLIWIVGEEKNWDLARLTCATAFLISRPRGAGD